MELFSSIWNFFEISAPYLLLGFVVSGLINEFVPSSKVQQWLGRGRFSDVLKSAFIGIPLPLCSCSVIPMAISLKKSGASNGATSSFLISTPESGIDSIAVSYSLLDLPLTIIRPIAAFFSALSAGALNHFFNSFEYQENNEAKKHCCHTDGSDHSHGAVNEKSKVLNILTYGFKDLLDDMVNWLIVGLIGGGLISYFVPNDLFLQFDPNINRLIILLVGVPLYICASASTPIAASLILKGMSPGTALIFLLVGPATNFSNLSVLQKYIGKKGIIFNIISVICVALAFSYLLDLFYMGKEVNLNFIENMHDHGSFSLIEKISSFIMLGLMIMSFYRVNLRRKK